MQVIALRNEFLSAEILPAVGGSLARLDANALHGPVPVLRPFTFAGSVPRPFTFAGSVPRPNQLACFPLVPWSNRMAGGFVCDGRRYRIAPNREGDPYPIHGEGWLLPWQIDQQTGTRLSLRLDRSNGDPFSYVAQLEYVLDGPSLEVRLEVINTGARALPFGLGLHPWMPRSAGVTLRAPAREVWLSGADRLPSHAVPVPDGWRFDQAVRLSATLVDNVFDGWDGVAEIAWPDRGVSLRIEADVRCYIVYTPPGGDFFCFEPVDHLINAHNLPGGPVRNGLTMLAPGEPLRRHFKFIVETTGA